MLSLWYRYKSTLHSSASQQQQLAARIELASAQGNHETVSYFCAMIQRRQLSYTDVSDGRMCPMCMNHSAKSPV